MPSARHIIEGVGLSVSTNDKVLVDVVTEGLVDVIREGVSCSVFDATTEDSVELGEILDDSDDKIVVESCWSVKEGVM